MIGASSAIGIEVVNELQNRGILAVKATSKAIKSIDYLDYSFDKTDFSLPPEIEKVIFLSWHRKRDYKSQQKSYEGFVRVSDLCRKKDINLSLVSSFAAAPKKPSSNYGRMKRKAELHAIGNGQQVVRVGTVFNGDIVIGRASSIKKNSGQSRLARLLVNCFQELPIPKVEINNVVKVLISDSSYPSTPQVINLYDTVTSLQEILDAKSGALSPMIFKMLARLNPKGVFDQTLVLLDLFLMNKEDGFFKNRTS